jgi:hypothetical protein
MGQRVDILKAVAVLGEIYDRQISKELVEVWNMILEDLSPDEVNRGVKLFMSNPANKFFPKPAEILALARPTANVDEEANILANKIIGAISKIGPYRSADAKSLLGEVGWTIVQLRGGWEQLCIVDNEQLGTLSAQLREIAKALLNKKKRGENITDVLKINTQSENQTTLSQFGIQMRELK